MKSTGQIGLVLVRRCTKMRQDWRVEFVCGGRAEQVASADFALLRTIGEKLSCAPEDAVAAIEKGTGERESNAKSLRVALEQLAGARATLLMQGARVGKGGMREVRALLREEDAALLLRLATELAKNEKTVALLGHEPTGQLVFAQWAGGELDLNALLKEVFAMVAGKGGGTREFVRGKLVETRRTGEALEVAGKLVGS